MSKVVQVSNYGHVSFQESSCSFDKLTKKEAEDIAEGLNRELNGKSSVWHIVVNDDYELCKGLEE